jgi:hypothetical protein
VIYLTFENIGDQLCVSVHLARNADMFLKVFASFHSRERRIRMKSPSLEIWFLLLLSLNFFDVFTTVPAYEVNPVTLYVWERLGFFLAAWLKIVLVLFFGLLCVVARKVANPNEWKFAKKLFLGLLKVLVVFYVFVVLINVAVSAI